MKKYTNNYFSFTGMILLVIFVVIEVPLVLWESFGSTDVFIGLITYTVMPVVLFFGVGLYVYGMWLNKVSEKKHEPTSAHIVLDLSNPKHLKSLFIVIIVVVCFFLASFIGSYKVYHYTESNEFCGTVCHDIMHPEYTTFQESPHARVKCAECHIGEGAGWYVQSKLSGARQIYHAIVGDYPRPIATPIENLRPAKETCGQCHWPKKFFGAIEQKHNYFPEEMENQAWRLKLLIKVGGGGVGKEGIHAHMFEDNEIFYVAEDRRRQNIPWVKVVSSTGVTKIYNSEDSPYKEAAPPVDKVRKMDCIDCHNRPSHRYKAPYRALNEGLNFGSISWEIPEIKQKTIELFEKEYETQDKAIVSIKKSLVEYYTENHSEILENKRQQFDSALVTIEKMYRGSIFPEMKARWDAYPDNIGHLISDGCFRCHDNKHVASKGEVITRDCNTCHLIIEQGLSDALETNTQGLPFRHPVDIDEEWKSENCSECHTGGTI
ncbi:MAG: NapC/NirT family cytochrome c [Fibrobacterales bacterium]